MIYADNAATTRLSATALAAMLPYLTEQYGNPSSLYTLGQTAATALAQAREAEARWLQGRPEEIVFTSGGSEADNQAILSAAAGENGRGKPISSPPPLSTTPSCTPSRNWRRRASP